MIPISFLRSIFSLPSNRKHFLPPEIPSPDLLNRWKNQELQAKRCEDFITSERVPMDHVTGTNSRNLVATVMNFGRRRPFRIFCSKKLFPRHFQFDFVWCHFSFDVVNIFSLTLALTLFLCISVRIFVESLLALIRREIIGFPLVNAFSSSFFSLVHRYIDTANSQARFPVHSKS